MPNTDTLRQVFVTSLGINEKELSDTLAYNSIRQWDSLGHMTLISGIDQAFDIMMDPDDIVALSTFSKAKEILTEKYGIHF
jgi:acyl carrier protein